MAKMPEPLEYLNAQAKEAVEEQALGAMDTYFGFIQNTVSSYPSDGDGVW